MDSSSTDHPKDATPRIAPLARTEISPKPIALTGFMGAGKTTVGRLLAEVLGRPFFDTDASVEERTGRRIDDFFLAGEEAEFRQREAETVADLVSHGAVVIALGGGALLDEDSRALLLERSVLVHVHVPWSDLRARVPDLVATRPLLQGKSLAEVHRLYRERLSIYRISALRITVGHRSPDDAASELLAKLRALDGA